MTAERTSTEVEPAGSAGDDAGPVVEEAQDGAMEAGSAHEGPERRRRTGARRRGAWIAVGVVVLAAGGAAAAAGLGGGSKDEQQGSALPPATAEVTRRTLQDTERADGQLGFGPATDAVARTNGTVTALPDSGDTVERGGTLYEADGLPVTLMYGSTPAYRELKEGSEGADVRQLEKNLDALGHDGFTVDDEYTAGTAAAVEAWQEDRGLPETGTVELGQVVFAPGAVRVDSLDAQLGTPVRPGTKVLSYTGTDKAVTAELDAADQRLAKEGATVDVVLPDDSTVKGRIEEVSTLIEPAQGQDEEAETKVEVVVGLTGDKAREAAKSYALAAVHVDFTAETRKDVLTVPVAALVALAEGGFGVEVVKGGASSYVPVKTGLFADGRVEISGIGAGTKVGVPR
ncbi:peptidoglycan-binding protein [Streptomyces sp. NPDC059897]|uniref:peptidoglycan-binding protein n=1 Tax=Streptomyces sp. NPDC059897 TaxID=3346994 RepID=UPI00365ECE0B